MKKTFSTFVFIFLASRFLSAQTATSLESTSKVDWTLNKFSSNLLLDVEKAGIQMPSGRTSADNIIRLKAPSLIKTPLLMLYVDSANYLGDLVMNGSITLEQMTDLIEQGKQSSEVLSLDGKSIKTTNTIDMKNIGKLLVKHKYPYIPEEPIESTPSRPFTGIIIDARGSVPVHGEYVKSEIFPCFFPTVWDEEMNIFYEKNVVDKEIANSKGIVCYNWSDDFSKYEQVVGNDPLYIKAEKVYGRNRTDPIIRKKDALKILSVPENKKLLSQGKVVILLEKQNLVYDVKVPQKDASYYATYKELKKYEYKNESEISVSDGLTGFLFSVDLKFIPDSPELLPAERPRIRKIAEMLKEIIKNNEFTILVEGHCADLGKPIGQMNLSIDRTKTVMNALIAEDIPEELFSYKGYGATRPIASNATEEGRAQNRRVDINARPKATYIQRN